MMKIIVFILLIGSAFGSELKIIESVDTPLFLDILKRMVDLIYEFESLRDEINNILKALAINSKADIKKWLYNNVAITNLTLTMTTEQSDLATVYVCTKKLDDKIGRLVEEIFMTKLNEHHSKFLDSQSIVLKSLKVLNNAKKQAMNVIYECTQNARNPICLDAEGVDEKVRKAIELTTTAYNNYRKYFYTWYWVFIPIEGEEDEKVNQDIKNNIIPPIKECYDKVA